LIVLIANDHLNAKHLDHLFCLNALVALRTACLTMTNPLSLQNPSVPSNPINDNGFGKTKLTGIFDIVQIKGSAH
jgi:hypothetical protein